MAGKKLDYSPSNNRGGGAERMRGTSYLLVRRAVEAGDLAKRGTATKMATDLGISRQAMSQLVARAKKDISDGR